MACRRPRCCTVSCDDPFGGIPSASSNRIGTKWFEKFICAEFSQNYQAATDWFVTYITEINGDQPAEILRNQERSAPGSSHSDHFRLASFSGFIPIFWDIFRMAARLKSLIGGMAILLLSLNSRAQTTAIDSLRKTLAAATSVPDQLDALFAAASNASH